MSRKKIDHAEKKKHRKYTITEFILSNVTDLKDWSRRKNIRPILTTPNRYHLLF